MALKYRADIDGLRAIAVVSVIAYHAGLPGWHGGFVGVDIFFVISGYLISSILWQEIQQGTFSFKKFYLRRARRIFPALFLIMLVAWPCAYYWLLPEHFEEFSNSLMYVSLFVSNLFFAKNSGYFDSAIELKPLIHTWSLAVEEQYYLLFPFFLLIFAKRSLRHLVIASVLFFLASLFLAQSNILGKTLGFYTVLTRVWEFFAGFAITVLIQKYALFNCRGLAYLGLGLLIAAIGFIDESVTYPGYYTILPVLGSMLLIVNGNIDNFIYKFLVSRTMVMIGLMSYSLYLWHQPVLAFYRYIQTDIMPVYHVLAILILIFILAWLSWRYVEKPFRNKQCVSDGKITLYSIVGSLCVFGLGFVGQANDGFPQRFSVPDSIQAKFIAKHFQQQCSAIDVGQDIQVCELGKTHENAVASVAVFGDSHALAMMPALDSFGKQHNIQFIHIAESACPPLFNVLVHNAHQDNQYCQRLAELQYEYVKTHPQIKQIIWIAKWASYTDGNYQGGQLNALAQQSTVPVDSEQSRQVFKWAATASAQRYVALGVKLAVLLQVPQQLSDVKPVYYRLYTQHSKAEDWRTSLVKYSVPLAKHEALQAYNREVFTELSRQGVLTVVNPDVLFCDTEVCLMGKTDTPFYRDADHLSVEGAALAMQALQSIGLNQ